MNFKPNLIKIIVSLIVGIIIPYIFITTFSQYGTFTRNFIDLITCLSCWLPIILIAWIVYGIWSLIQKNKSKSRK